MKNRLRKSHRRGLNARPYQKTSFSELQKASFPKLLEPRRAQITVFIIIGALVVVAFGITLYIGTNITKKTESKETQQKIEQLGIQPINEYITTCLTLASSEALHLIGRQGGAIYKKQGGLTADFAPEQRGKNYVTYTDPDLGVLDVAYLIIPPEGTVGINCENLNACHHAQPPRYPFDTFPTTNGKQIFTGYYGVNKLPSLYKYSEITQDYVAGSIQENLETYIAKRTTDCAKWEQFTGYQFSTGPATASLLFANQSQQLSREQTISITLIWPVEITTPGGDKTILTEYAIKLPVRLANIYYTIKQIVDTDVTDITYQPQNTAAYQVNRQPYGQDSFITVTDAQSLVKNKPFEFWIPRKNRIPALWHIDPNKFNDIVLHVNLENNQNTKINVIELNATHSRLSFNDPCDEHPEIELIGSDPDEDPTKFAVYIPGSSTNEIPTSAKDQTFSITIFAHDQTANTNNQYDDSIFDSQEIPVQVAPCEIR